MANESIVVLENLVKKYGAFTAVDNVELEVPRGTVFGVLGPNGAGKTTTLRMITGLLQPTSGTITIDGHRMDTDPVTCKQITGFIPDRPYIYDKLTAFEYLAFVGGLYGLDGAKVARRVRELLELFELAEWADSLIESFSHGMKQRLTFAGALLPEPKLLVVDEPMVGLDPKGHRLIKNLFRRLTERDGMTILLSTHTLEVAEEVCDQVAIIAHGRVMARGTMEELRSETGTAKATLEQVFLKITEETEVERAERVANRFGHHEAYQKKASDEKDAL